MARKAAKTKGGTKGGKGKGKYRVELTLTEYIDWQRQPAFAQAIHEYMVELGGTGLPVELVGYSNTGKLFIASYQSNTLTFITPPKPLGYHDHKEFD